MTYTLAVTSQIGTSKLTTHKSRKLYIIKWHDSYSTFYIRLTDAESEETETLWCDLSLDTNQFKYSIHRYSSETIDVPDYSCCTEEELFQYETISTTKYSLKLISQIQMYIKLNYTTITEEVTEFEVQI